MNAEHLFELTYIILEKKTVTASEMAHHFGVSTRTIYRWVDALNLAGVPVVTTKGRCGGIALSDKYFLDKAVLTEDEKLEILSSVQAFSSLKESFEDSEPLKSSISKLKAITNYNADWIKVDFATWNPEHNEIKDIFKNTKWAILNKRQVCFDYYSLGSESSNRTVDPWKIIFRGQAWYLYGFCKMRKAPRYFKLNRIRSFRVLMAKATVFEKDFSNESEKKSVGTYCGDEINGYIKLKARVFSSEIYRILDEFIIESIEDDSENTKILTFNVPDVYWIKSWILSFGSSIKVIEPKYIAEQIVDEAKKMLN